MGKRRAEGSISCNTRAGATLKTSENKMQSDCGESGSNSSRSDTRFVVGGAPADAPLTSSCGRSEARNEAMDNSCEANTCTTTPDCDSISPWVESTPMPLQPMRWRTSLVML